MKSSLGFDIKLRSEEYRVTTPQADNCLIEIVIPVYNEGENILNTLKALDCHVKTPFRVLICYDQDDDTTLKAIKSYSGLSYKIEMIKNQGKKAHGAVITGMIQSRAPAIITYMADDDYNPKIIDQMVDQFNAGSDIVVASRFIPGGNMVGCRWQKAGLVRLVAFIMHAVLALPAHDPTNGFRLFSRRVIEQIPIESKLGFSYSIELLVKCNRLGWEITEVPAQWYERTHGKSRFSIIEWAPEYLSWVYYQLETLILLAVGKLTSPLKTR
jgi:dolichol-phosphate mannosyltransferase